MSELTPGEFCWNELLTSDIGAAKKFYGDLFGWQTDDIDMNGMTYSMVRAPGAAEGPAGMAGGMMQSPMPDIPPHWLSYVAVEDVEATVAKAESLGATVIKGVTELPMGIFAVISDPQGAALAFWKKKPCPEEG